MTDEHGEPRAAEAAESSRGAASDAATAPVHVIVAAPTWAERRALRVMQTGAVLAVLAAVTWKIYELDRFFVPKELTLHLTACIAGMLVVRSMRETRFTWVDVLLALHLLLGAVSTVLATNPWLAMRALTISASGVAVFWSARVLRTAGLARGLTFALALAVVIGCITSLLQTYGVETDFFSINRAPGGTFGNRNFVAHMAAFGLPVVLLTAACARNVAGYLLGTLGAALTLATLFLTRSRAAWLACAAVAFVFIVAFVIAPALRRDARTVRRIIGMLVLAAAAVAGALLIPNTLDWSSENPYLESMRDVANYEEGSGRGRLVQYRQSLMMAAEHPVLGVGPGNWAVVYPDHAADNDPSMDRSTYGMTSNPWPSSDWIALVSERGLPAALLLVLALMGIAVRGLQRLVAAADARDALRAAALLGTLLGAGIAGMFDAVLLLAHPTLLVWAALGVLWDPAEGRVGARVAPLRTAAMTGVIILAGIGAVRSALQLTAMGIDAQTSSTAWLQRAAFIDPGNYSVRLQLGRGSSGLNREERCSHAHAAHALYPNAGEADRLSRNCE